MAFRLVIAEKPSVAQTIAAALGIKGKQDGYIEGGGYLISWCVGHLVQLAEAAAYGEQYRKWQLDSLPILPEEWQYAVDPDKGKQFATLKELMHRADVSEVINACDAGREGELIFRFVYEVAGCKMCIRDSRYPAPHRKRVFSSTTRYIPLKRTIPVSYTHLYGDDCRHASLFPACHV